jgi:hypothetical protein
MSRTALTAWWKRLFRRLRALRQRAATPADLLLIAQVTAWLLLLLVLKRLLPLPALVRFAGGRSRARKRRRDREDRIVSLAWWLCGPRGEGRGHCLERSLVIYRLLSLAGADPQLVISTSKADGKLFGHAWVAVDGEPVGEPAASLSAFRPLLVFGGGGTAGIPPAARKRTSEQQA